ncbi:hypothetical protein IS519_21450 [Vibrio crassostreae]|uniref:hypothetical protein n=1 Tax=Vibrio crassostreae TaxID=246167 RepID=UPI00200A450D|nr:hypothetical protein [Vibrio crassostreae]UPR31427.1 hypothetical protein IS519_21450 [Vibrio crassostreae]
MRILIKNSLENLSFDIEIAIYSFISMILLFVMLTFIFTIDFNIPNLFEAAYTYTLETYSYTPNAHDIEF